MLRVLIIQQGAQRCSEFLWTASCLGGLHCDMLSMWAYELQDDKGEKKRKESSIPRISETTVATLIPCLPFYIPFWASMFSSVKWELGSIQVGYCADVKNAL